MFCSISQSEVICASAAALLYKKLPLQRTSLEAVLCDNTSDTGASSRVGVNTPHGIRSTFFSTPV